MFNRIDINLFQIVMIVFLVISSKIDGINSFKLENQNASLKPKLKSCIPCNTSKYQTLKSLEHQFVVDKNLKDKELECWHGGLKSMMMHYDNYELDLEVSIMNPYQNKNEGCSFEVYWDNKFETTILINPDGKIKSSNSSWYPYQHPGENGKEKFWLVKKAPKLHSTIINEYSGKNPLYTFFSIYFAIRAIKSLVGFGNLDCIDSNY